MESQTVEDVVGLAEHLQTWFERSATYVVALSGGVDSAVVACAGARAGVHLIGATARSPSVSRRDLEDAAHVASWLDIPHHWVEPSEHLSDDYRRNDERRCYYCKSHLFAALRREFSESIILTGTNADDLNDYRPGIEAAKKAEVRSPLAELKIGKRGVRALAEYWKIPVAEKPASPCLASRIAYHVEVTPERLAMIELAESVVRRLLEINDCRVRLHENQLARIEIAPSAFSRLVESNAREQMVTELERLGFRFITFDLAGQRSGSLNSIVIKSSAADR